MSQSVESSKSNKAYALVIGINEFLKHKIKIKGNTELSLCPVSKLYHAERSADQMVELLQLAKSGLFGSSYQYQKIIKLKGKEATLLNVVNGIIELARITKPGDVVTMSFSTHGLSESRTYDAPDTNTMFLYDLFFSESQLYALLKLFNPGIRFYLLFDMCQAGTWLDTFSNDYMALDVAISQLEFDLKDTSPLLSKFFLDHKHELLSGDLPNTLLTYNGIQDGSDMSDSENSIRFLYVMFVEKLNKLYTYRETLEITKPFFYNSFTDIDAFRQFYNQYFLYLNDGIKKTDPAYNQPPDLYVFDKKNPLHLKIYNMIIPKFRFVGEETQQYLDKKMFSLF